MKQLRFLLALSFGCAVYAADQIPVSTEAVTPIHGALPIGDGTNWVAGALSAGANITITPTGTNIVIAATGGGGGGSGTVTSVGLALPSIFSVSGSPVTTSGTLTGSLANQNANLVWAGPSTGSPATPTFRSLVAADIPTLSYGDVFKVGTPANNQVGVWTGNGTIEGDSNLTFDTTTDTLATVAISASGTSTFSTVNATDLTATTFVIDGGSAPVLTAFGEVSSDNNSWASGRGALVFFDGTATTTLVGTQTSDTPSNGQVPTWNTGGTITWETPSGGVVDGDKGDITVSSSGSVWTVDNDAITYAKFQNASAGNVVLTRAAGTSGDYGETAVGASQLVGRGSTGDIAAITLGSGLSMSGTTLSATGGGSSPTTTRGDMIYRGASADTRLPIGGFGDLLSSDGTDPFWESQSRVIRFQDDFFYAQSATIAETWATVGSINFGSIGAADGNHWGIARFRSTGADQVLYTAGNQADHIVLGSGNCYVEWIIKTVSDSGGAPAPSNATDNYTLVVGLGDTVTGAAAQTDGVFFRYNHAVNSGNWERVTESNGSEEALNTGVAYVGNAWIRLGMLITGGTSVQFFIDGVSVGTNSTGANIPTGTSRALGVVFICDRTAGTAERNMYIDAFNIVFRPTTAR